MWTCSVSGLVRRARVESAGKCKPPQGRKGGAGSLSAGLFQNNHDAVAQKGRDIHALMDPYAIHYMETKTQGDKALLKLLNLETKLTDLVKSNYVHELEVNLPWLCFIGHDNACAAGGEEWILKGVLDGVEKKAKLFTVEELKTHAQGYEVPGNGANRDRFLQTKIYTLMLERLLSCLRSRCQILRRYLTCGSLSEEGGRIPKVSEYFRRCLNDKRRVNTEHLWSDLCDIAYSIYPKTVPVRGVVIHLSQPLTERSIAMGLKDVPCTYESVPIRRSRLVQFVQKLTPWTTSSG